MSALPFLFLLTAALAPSGDAAAMVRASVPTASVPASPVRTAPAHADSVGSVRGRVLDDGGAPVPDAIVRVVGTQRSIRSDSAGRYHLSGIPAGEWSLRVMRVGFGPSVATVRVVGGGTVAQDLRLTARGEALGAVTVTAALREQYVGEAPVRTEVVTARALQRNVTANLMDNLPFVSPGLSVQVDCGVCFTNSIRINGMDGPYTAVLIDGTPVMSALASVYGFNGLHPALIEQVEVIRGPLSTLYGSEAMGGVVNIVTKDPRLAPRYSFNSFVTSDGEMNVDAAFAPSVGGRRLLLSANAAYNDRFVDRDPDGFADLPLVQRFSAFAKLGEGPAEARTYDVTARWYQEERFGGTRAWTRGDLGSSSVYGELITTERAEFFGNWRLPVADRSLRLWYSGTWHAQDSWYGDTRYAATQGTGFAQLLWDRTRGRHALQAGGTLRYQRYDDTTPATASADHSLIAGVFAQDEVAVGDGLTVLGGLRLDHYQRHGLIPAPRLALTWRPFGHDHTTLRLNAASGFRIVNLFTEDHAALTGARQVLITEDLLPERSTSVTLGLEQHVHLAGGRDVLVLGVDAFLTRFSNRILPDYDTDPNLIVYDNLDGSSTSQGVTLSAQLDAPTRPYSLSAGVTIQDVTVTEGGVRTRQPFAARVLGTLTAGFRLPGGGTTLDWTARVVGPMALPEFQGRPTASPWFSEHHLQLTHPITRELQLYGAVRNLFDYRQANAILGADAPFSDAFDTSYVYGPLQGRRVLLGLRVTGAR
jgi:outer membrane receptor for ferrienterochelin and colicins